MRTIKFDYDDGSEVGECDKIEVEYVPIYSEAGPYYQFELDKIELIDCTKNGETFVPDDKLGELIAEMIWKNEQKEGVPEDETGYDE